MRRGFQKFFPFFCLSLMLGCAPVISQHLRDEADPTLTFRQVFQAPDAFQGKIVIWGGEIIETLNQEDGKTLVEVLQRPLDWREEPKPSSASEGRFLARSDTYLDPYVFSKGKEITVAGEILGQKTKPIGQMEYHYPLLAIKQIHLWSVPYPPAYPYQYYYDPWWYYYPWYPRWYYSPWYPRWGWGFRFHYHR